MPAVIIIGAQWGDEGKGKLVDILSSQSDFVVRYQGGANAGHTLKVEKEEVVVHLVPSSVFHPHVKSVISAGVALDISTLCKEIHQLKQINKLKDDKQLLISDSATLLLDHHKLLDKAREKRVVKIGTTGKGVGPAYECRASRKALLFSDLFQTDKILLEKLKEQMREFHFLLSGLYKKKSESPEEILNKIKNYRKFLKNYRCKDVSLLLYTALKENKNVLFEGAQGTLLDLFYGTYPYVTSSSTLAAGALASSGLGLNHSIHTLAVSKAYTTRVGKGPFPTECLDSPAGLHFQKEGAEFGATTGRKRRCGWLDLCALQYAIRLNGAHSLALMKLDVLSGLKEIKVCTAYKIEGNKIKNFPDIFKSHKKAIPIYKTFKGWMQNLSSIKNKTELPKEALEYIDFISHTLNIPIDILSVGPLRSQTLWLRRSFCNNWVL